MSSNKGMKVGDSSRITGLRRGVTKGGNVRHTPKNLNRVDRDRATREVDKAHRDHVRQAAKSAIRLHKDALMELERF